MSLAKIIIEHMYYEVKEKKRNERGNGIRSGKIDVHLRVSICGSGRT